MPEDETKVAAATAAAATPAASETPASPAAEQPAEEAAAAAAPLSEACGGSDTGADADAEAETGGGDGDGSDSGSGEYMQYGMDHGDEEDEEFEEDDFFDEEFEEYEEFEEDEEEEEEEEEEESSAAIRDAGLEGLITSFAKLQLGRGGGGGSDAEEAAPAADGAGDAPRGDASLAAAAAPAKKRTGTIPVTSVVDLANIKLSLLRNLSLPAEAVPATIVAAARWALVAHGLSADVASADAAMAGIAIVAVDSPADKADPQTYGKNTRLHELLRAKGVELLLNRPKQHPGATSVQGSVDVSIAVEFLRMSHCFRRDAAEAPAVVAGTPQLAILASGDADFQPAIEAALALNPDLIVGVLARREGVSRLYREWINTHSTRLVLVPLEQLADGMRDLDVRRVPRRDFDSEGAWVAAVVAALEASTASAVSLRASHCGVLDGAALGALARALARAPAAAAARLTELWVDHCNRVGPAAVEGLGGIVAAAPNLSQIHISNTGVTAACLVTLANRAQGAPGRQDRKLYMNATFTQVSPQELSGARFTPVSGGGQYVRRNVRIKIGTNYGSRRTARMQPFGAKGGKGGGGGGGGDVSGGFGAKGSKGGKGGKGGGKGTKGSKGGKKGAKGGEKGGGAVAAAAPAQPLGPRGQKRPKKQSPFAKKKKDPEAGGKAGSGGGGKGGAGKGSGKGSKGGAKGGKQQKKKKK